MCLIAEWTMYFRIKNQVFLAHFWFSFKTIVNFVGSLS
jgi:hypothetical protein